MNTWKAAFAVTGEERKKLVQAIADVLGTAPQYRGAPGFAYDVGAYTVSRDGTVTAEPGTAHAELLEALAQRGFIPQTAEPDEASETNDTVRLEITVPADNVSVGVLKRILESKETLFKKALDTDGFPIVENGDGTVTFPWFNRELTPDESLAYTHLIAALCKLSTTLHRVNQTDHDVPNEKYAFRCFLLRLGLIGNEYKKTRKILLRNLSGSSAFRDGRKTEGAENE